MLNIMPRNNREALQAFTHFRFISSSLLYELHLRKPDFCLCENKGADQLRSNCEADQRLCFRFTDSTLSLLLKLLACFCDCTGRFVSDLVGNPEDRFSRVAAHMSCMWRKPAFNICKSKDADQLCSNCTADQHLCFRSMDIGILLLL